MNQRVFIDFSSEETKLGRIVLELFTSLAPKTCENFRSLICGSAGLDAQGQALWFRGSLLSKVIRGFMIQGGIKSTIYGDKFADENLSNNIDAAGLLVSANKGKNTNSSQWFISLRPCPHLDGKNVVFGRVVSGMEVVEGISKMEVDEKDVPIRMISISGCGELERRVVVKKRSITPESGSESGRSASPPPKKSKSSKSKEKKEKRIHRPRDENGKRIKSKHLPPPPTLKSLSPPPQTPEQLAASIALQESLKREDEERKIAREEELRKLKERYEERRERMGEGEKVEYKGRGAMKAPGRNTGMRGWN